MPLRAPLNFLITGGARGIGRGLTTHLLRAGHNLFILDSDAGELSHTVSLLAPLYPARLASTPCDVRSPSSIASALTLASAHFSGRLDVLVNNAALTATLGTPFATLPLSDWAATLDANLTGPFLVSQAALPMLKAAGGCVVHVSSTRARQSEEGGEAYAASKAGLLGLSQAMAVSLGGAGVRVNALVLGWISVGELCKEGDETGVGWAEGVGREEHEWHPAGRVGRVEDVVRAVEYLVEAEWVTGAEVVVDGGVTRKMVYPE